MKWSIDDFLYIIYPCRFQSDWSGESALPCGYKPTTDDNQPLVRTIYVSTMAFVQQVAPESYARRRNERWFHVCYSFHSSYGELREVIFFLRPHHAYPNVIPMGDTMPQVGAGLRLMILCIINRGRPWRYSIIPSPPDFQTGYQIRRNSNPAGIPVFAAIWGPDFRPGHYY